MLEGLPIEEEKKQTMVLHEGKQVPYNESVIRSKYGKKVPKSKIEQMNKHKEELLKKLSEKPTESWKLQVGKLQEKYPKPTMVLELGKKVEYDPNARINTGRAGKAPKSRQAATKKKKIITEIFPRGFEVAMRTEIAKSEKWTSSVVNVLKSKSEDYLLKNYWRRVNYVQFMEEERQLMKLM